MKKLGILITLVVILFGFTPKNKVVYIQPLGDVKPEYLKLVKEGVESFYHFQCVIKKPIPLTNDLLVNSKTRYSADKILSKFNNQQNYLVLTLKIPLLLNQNLKEM